MGVRSDAFPLSADEVRMSVIVDFQLNSKLRRGG